MDADFGIVDECNNKVDRFKFFIENVVEDWRKKSYSDWDTYEDSHFIDLKLSNFAINEMVNPYIGATDESAILFAQIINKAKYTSFVFTQPQIFAIYESMKNYRLVEGGKNPALSWNNFIQQLMSYYMPSERFKTLKKIGVMAESRSGLHALAVYYNVNNGEIELFDPNFYGPRVIAKYKSYVNLPFLSPYERAIFEDTVVQMLKYSNDSVVENNALLRKYIEIFSKIYNRPCNGIVFPSNSIYQPSHTNLCVIHTFNYLRVKCAGNKFPIGCLHGKDDLFEGLYCFLFDQKSWLFFVHSGFLLHRLPPTEVILSAITIDILFTIFYFIRAKDENRRRILYAEIGNMDKVTVNWFFTLCSLWLVQNFRNGTIMSDTFKKMSHAIDVSLKIYIHKKFNIALNCPLDQNILLDQFPGWNQMDRTLSII